MHGREATWRGKWRCQCAMYRRRGCMVARDAGRWSADLAEAACNAIVGHPEGCWVEFVKDPAAVRRWLGRLVVVRQREPASLCSLTLCIRLLLWCVRYWSSTRMVFVPPYYLLTALLRVGLMRLELSTQMLPLRMRLPLGSRPANFFYHRHIIDIGVYAYLRG